MKHVELIPTTDPVTDPVAASGGLAGAPILIDRARGGDREAFCRLVEPHWASLVRLARSVVGEEDAEDATQEGLLSSWSRLSGLREPAAFPAWLHRIVLRHCLRLCRRRRLRFWEASQEAPEHEPAAPAGDPSGVLHRQQSAWVARLLRRLPPRQRAVMHLTVVEERTDREIAEVMGITAASVRSHRRRARSALRRRLEGGNP